MTKYLNHVIKKTFPNAEIIHVVSDGASWITKLAKKMNESKEFKEVNRFIDKYYFKTYVKDLLVKNY